MKVVTWNIRGLGRREKGRVVRKLIHKEKLDMIHIQETKLKDTNERTFRRLWGKNGHQGVSSNASGSSGRVISLWDKDFFTLESSMVFNRFIVLIGEICKTNFKCAFINVYAPNDDEDRRILFSEVSKALKNLLLSLCICGDFNVIREAKERIGITFNGLAMRDFMDFIEENKLVDLSLYGNYFTWCSNRAQPSFSRLDRFLLSPEFLETSDNFIQTTLPRSLSDHNPVILAIDIKEWGPKPFRFFNYWLSEKGFLETFGEAWGAVNADVSYKDDLWRKLKSVKPCTKSWYKENFGSNELEIQKIEAEIDRFEKSCQVYRGDENTKKEIGSLKGDLWRRYKMEEASWLKKSRLQWFRRGIETPNFSMLLL